MPVAASSAVPLSHRCLFGVAVLYPPLTFLKPTGWKMGHAAGGAKYQVIEVEPLR